MPQRERNRKVITGRWPARWLGCIAALALASCSGLRPPAGLPHAFVAGWQGQSVCTVLRDDETLRVARCDFPPGVGHERHYHNPHFGYTLSAGTMRLDDEDGVEVREIPAGVSWYSDEISVHEVLNVGATTSSYLIVEPR